MKLSYINYLRLINNKLIREGVNLSVDLRDDMSISELEEAKTVLESYCYFNDVLTKCDSAYALDVTDGCKAKLYTDTIRDEVLAQYKEKFDSALALLYQDRPNPLDKTATVEDLSNYLKKNGKSLKASDFAIEVDVPVSEEPTQVMQYSDIFAIQPNNELIYTDDSGDEEEFDYSDEEIDEEDLNSSEEVSGYFDEDEFDYSDEDVDLEEVSESDEDSEDDVFYDFSDSSSSSDEDDDEFDYSDEDSEGIDTVEELPLDESDDQVVFDFSDKEGITSNEDEEFNYDEDDEYVESEEDEFDYSESEEDSEFIYDDESSEDEDEFNYDDESNESDEDEFIYDDDESFEDDIDYSEDGEEDEFSYEDELEEDETSYNEDDEEFNYDEEDTPSGSIEAIQDAPVFDVGGQMPSSISTTRQKEDFEKDAELIEGIVVGGTKLLRGAGEKLKKSLFSKKP